MMGLAEATNRDAGNPITVMQIDAPPAGFVRVVLACRACGHVDVVDVRPGAMSPERLRAVWRCFGCGRGAEPAERRGRLSLL
jgi:hypothetical protein